MKEWEEILSQNDIYLDLVGVVAKERKSKTIKIEQKNLDVLIYKTVENIQKARSGCLYEEISNNLSDFIISEIQDENAKIMNVISKEMLLYFQTFDYKLPSKLLLEFIYNQFKICILNYLVEFKAGNISDKTLEILLNLFKEKLAATVKLYERKCTNKIKEILYPKTIEITDIQFKTLLSKDTADNNGKVQYLLNTREISEKITDFLRKHIYYISQKNFINLIMDNILKPFNENLKKIYDELVDHLMEKEENIALIDEVFERKYEDLKEKISGKFLKKTGKGESVEEKERRRESEEVIDEEEEW